MKVPADTPAVVSVPALLSVAHVAELIGRSPKTVRRRIADGELSAVIEGDQLMVRGDDLRAYVDGLERVGRRRRSRPAPSRTYGFLR